MSCVVPVAIKLATVKVPEKIPLPCTPKTREEVVVPTYKLPYKVVAPPTCSVEEANKPPPESANKRLVPAAF